jgi:hypothetical protein
MWQIRALFTTVFFAFPLQGCEQAHYQGESKSKSPFGAFGGEPKPGM